MTNRINFDNYSVLDIETNASAEPTELGIYNTRVGFSWFDTVEQTVDYILENELFLIYAHNGLAFDYAIIITELLSRVEDLQIATSAVGGVFIKFKYKKHTYTLLDSYRLLPAGLNKLGKQLEVEHKKVELDVMPWDLSKEDRVTYLKYDCLCLYEVIGKFWEVIDSVNTGHKLRAVTLASLALKAFNVTLKRNRLIVSSGKLAKFEADSYFGGLVYCNFELAKKVHKVKVYDVNSMYPWAMSAFMYPKTYSGGWVTKYDSKQLGIYHVSFSIPPVGLPFVFDCNTRSLAYSGVAIINNETIDYIRYLGGSVSVNKGYIYQNVGYIFKDYVDKYYGLRREYGNQTAIGYVSKILLNCLYGKFAEKPNKRMLTTNKPNLKDGFKVYDGGSVEVFDYESPMFITHRFPVISSLVTMRSRLRLRQLADSFPCHAIAYSDTDSLHVLSEYTDDVHIDIGNNLGQLKLEFEGLGIYWGKKIYQLQHGDDIVKFVAKGIPKTSLEASGLKLQGMPIGGVVYEFHSYSSLLSVLKNPIKGFVRTTATRTLKPTVKKVR